MVAKVEVEVVVVSAVMVEELVERIPEEKVCRAVHVLALVRSRVIASVAQEIPVP